jgi:alkanesulfonate monooxygenase SsuD/methylene tetrahydromethanopterin reductase-like flavin-dependent oxidoreductase (luciferase family)
VGTPYAAEQQALGRPVPADPARRAAVAATIATLRDVWSGATGGAAGFLQPSPPPPVIVGGFGPKMAELAGRLGDGINVPAGPSLPRLLDVAREARAAGGRDPETLLVTTSGSPGDERLARLGVHRVITMVRPPYVESVGHLARTIGRR